jgi:Putative ATPase subunit of terminase (gpP-like)
MIKNPFGNKGRQDIDWHLALFLYRFGGYTYTRIATALGVPYSTIKEHAKRHNWARAITLDSPNVHSNGASSPQNRVSRAGRRASPELVQNAPTGDLSYFAAGPKAVKKLLADSQSGTASQGTADDAP